MKLPRSDEILARLPLPQGLRVLPGVYVVGGAVRDAILGREIVDLDLAVDGELGPALAALGGQARSNERFGTAAVRVDGREFDLARTRRERYPAPGALPVVEPAPLAEDLARRDFTVNAIAVPVHGGPPIAAPAAFADLDARQLRVLHAESFIDDPTRLFRMVRYAVRLGFSVEAETLSLAHRAITGASLTTLSRARIGNELRLLAGEPDPVRAFVALDAVGLAGQVAPGFGLADPSLAERTLLLLPPDGRRDLAVLAIAFREVAVGSLRVLLDELEFTAHERDLIVSVAERAEKLSYRLEMAGPPSEIDLVAGSASIELVAIAGAIGPTGAAREWLVELRGQRLAINGEDLIAAGVPAGPAVGSGLAAARGAMLDGEAPDAAAQLAAALAAL